MAGAFNFVFSSFDSEAGTLLTAFDMVSVGDGSMYNGSPVVAAMVGAAATGAGTTPSTVVYVLTQAATAWVLAASLQGLLSGVPISGNMQNASLSGSYATVVYSTSANPTILPLDGSAFIFVRDASWVWSLVQGLIPSNPSDPVSGDGYGDASALSGNYAMVSAPANPGGSGGGAVYVFQNMGGTWSQVQKLAPGDLTSGDDFGLVMYAVGPWLFVVAPNQNTFKGAVYIFQLQSGSYVQTQKLSGVGASEHFGSSVNSDGATLAIGAIQNPFAQTGFVKTYTLVGGLWTLQQTIAGGSDSSVGDEFGKGVSVNSTLLVVGAPLFNSSEGKVYVFANTAGTWVQVQGIVNNGSFAELFGTGVACLASAGSAGAQLTAGGTTSG
jgi:FG-GAP repeat